MPEQILDQKIQTENVYERDNVPQCGVCGDDAVLEVEVIVIEVFEPEQYDEPDWSRKEAEAWACEEHEEHLIEETEEVAEQAEVLGAIAMSDPAEIREIGPPKLEGVPYDAAELSEILDPTIEPVPIDAEVVRVTRLETGDVVYCEVCEADQPDADSLYEHMIGEHGWYDESMEED